jgi:cellulose synthase/poly-beta-1,6-N-acetylglucosamine synthase-like glycosyltransferase
VPANPPATKLQDVSEGLMAASTSRLGVVVIGRNEGERLPRCLATLGAGYPVVYADSGSTDGSCAAARERGAEVVEMDARVPFTAARGRNEGIARLLEKHPAVEYVQFVDGDCEIIPGWLEQAASALDGRPEVAAVCGGLKEKHPERSIYNFLCNLEWEGTAGEVKACGGNAMYRVAAFREAGGFNGTITAGEEPELCQRLRGKGWKILRLGDAMAVHDSDMMHFGQWWRRSVRGGYGGLDVVRRFDKGWESAFARQLRSARMWALGWPLAVVMAGFAGWLAVSTSVGVLAASVAALVLPAQMVRLALRARTRGGGAKVALAYGVMTMLSKWGAAVGQMRYLADVRAGRKASPVEETGTSWVP